MKGFGLAVQQASPRAGKQSSVPAHYHTKPHATLQEQRGPQQKKKKNPILWTAQRHPSSLLQTG